MHIYSLLLSTCKECEGVSIPVIIKFRALVSIITCTDQVGDVILLWRRYVSYLKPESS
jgi:hypothetical protein